MPPLQMTVEDCRQVYAFNKVPSLKDLKELTSSVSVGAEKSLTALGNSPIRSSSTPVRSKVSRIRSKARRGSKKIEDWKRMAALKANRNPSVRSLQKNLSNCEGMLRSLQNTIEGGLAPPPPPATPGKQWQQQRRRLDKNTSLNQLLGREYHAARSSIQAILMFLEMHGVAKGSIQELAGMEFLPALQRAEEYVELILFELVVGPQGDANIEALTMLLDAAWTKLVEYAQANAREASKAYWLHERNQHREVVAQYSLSENDQEGMPQRMLQHTRLEQWDPTERQELIEDLNKWTRAKMDAEKGFVLYQEWTRYIKAQQKRIHKYRADNMDGSMKMSDLTGDQCLPTQQPSSSSGLWQRLWSSSSRFFGTDEANEALSTGLRYAGEQEPENEATSSSDTDSSTTEALTSDDESTTEQTTTLSSAVPLQMHYTAWPSNLWDMNFVMPDEEIVFDLQDDATGGTINNSPLNDCASTKSVGTPTACRPRGDTVDQGGCPSFPGSLSSHIANGLQNSFSVWC